MAGISKMHYNKFLSFNAIGGTLWVIIISSAGFFLGNYKVVQENFTIVVYAIVVISILPAVIEVIKHRVKNKTTA